MRIEKKGFVLYLEGTWMEISNKYGTLERGNITENSENINEKYAEKQLEVFIQQHSIAERSNSTCVKKVALNSYDGYTQLQAVLPDNGEYWYVQKYDNELVYMGEELTGCKYRDEVQDWMRKNFDIASCLTANVYRSSRLGDCTNGGISSYEDKLYILSYGRKTGPFEPEDIRQCVHIEWRDVCEKKYINCVPAYFIERWYMAGGNFLYTSDSRFEELTKSKYPIPIHDRYEGR